MPDLHLHLRSIRGVDREWDAEPVVIAIDMPGDGDPEQEAGDLAAALTVALPEETLSRLAALLLAEMATRLPWHRILRMVADAADAAALGDRGRRGAPAPPTTWP